METPPCSWVDFGNLAIGIGTFILAIVLGIATWLNSSRDRKVHIANKRQDWINELRIMVSEYLSIVEETWVVNNVPNDNFRRLLALKAKFPLMLNPNENSSKELLENLDELYEGLFKEGKVSKEGFDVLKKDLLETTQQILKTEWNKIKKLKE